MGRGLVGWIRGVRGDGPSTADEERAAHGIRPGAAVLWPVDGLSTAAGALQHPQTPPPLHTAPDGKGVAVVAPGKVQRRAKGLVAPGQGGVDDILAVATHCRPGCGCEEGGSMSVGHKGWGRAHRGPAHTTARAGHIAAAHGSSPRPHPATPTHPASQPCHHARTRDEAAVGGVREVLRVLLRGPQVLDRQRQALAVLLRARR